MATVFRALQAYAKLAELVPDMEDLSSKISKKRIEDTKRLYKDIVTNNLAQATTHLGTAGLCLVANWLFGSGTRFGLDSMGAGQVAQKLGETVSTGLRSSETGSQGELKRVEHELNKGPDKSHRELLEHTANSVRNMMEWHGRAMMGG